MHSAPIYTNTLGWMTRVNESNEQWRWEVDCMEMSFLWQNDISKSERHGLQDGSETWYDVWFEDGGTVKKTGGWTEDVEIFIVSDQAG